MRQNATGLMWITGLWLATALATTACNGGNGGNDGDDDAPDAGLDCATEPDGCEYRGRQLGVAGRAGGSFTDPMTGRVIPLYVRFPDGPGPYPVVIWSHGGGLNDTGHLLNAEWGDTIAANGFIVIHLAHVTLAADTGAALCELAAVPADECALGVVPGDDEAPFVTIARPRDVIALIDALPGLADAFTGAGGPAVDTSRVVVGGWSGGSRAPMVLLGASRRLTPSLPDFTMPDARPVAAIAISPAGAEFFGFYDEPRGTSWDDMRGPMLVMTGNNDVKSDLPALVGSIRRQADDLQPADGTRRLLYSNLPADVGEHGTYNLADLESSDARLAGLSRALRSTLLAYLDATVHDDDDAQAWLDSERAVRLGGDVDYQTR